jgi:magnesium transporter
VNIKAYLYDSDGYNEVEFGEDICESLGEDKMLWISVLERDRETLEAVLKAVKFEGAPVKSILDTEERPKLDKYENFYRLFINSVAFTEENKLERIPIDFVVGQNVVVTVKDGEVGYFEEFRKLEEGERHIGQMDTESFVATLLDLHIVSYYRAVEEIERRVDKFDDRILTSEMSDEEFFAQMIALRRDASLLRRWLMPHRDVFYALSRPDFEWLAESDSAGHFQNLNQRFEGAVDSIESLRDTILSLFDLYATQTSHQMNDLMKRLTFVATIFGALGVVAGTLGMNFEAGFFKQKYGFWLTLLGMAILSVILFFAARKKDWV